MKEKLLFSSASELGKVSSYSVPHIGQVQKYVTIWISDAVMSDVSHFAGVMSHLISITVLVLY